MPAPASHEILEHTGELRLRLRAGSWAALLVEGGRALATLALRGRTPGPPGPWHEVAVEAADRGALLVDWLNELIYQAESGTEVPTEFEALEAGELRVTARWRGVAVPEPPVLVKAATLHDVRVERCAAGWEGEVVLDI